MAKRLSSATLGSAVLLLLAACESAAPSPNGNGVNPATGGAWSGTGGVTGSGGLGSGQAGAAGVSAGAIAAGGTAAPPLAGSGAGIGGTPGAGGSGGGGAQGNPLGLGNYFQSGAWRGYVWTS